MSAEPARVHPDCGAWVAVADLAGGEHRCRDYVAWHSSVDNRDPDLWDWPCIPPCSGLQAPVGELAAA